MSVAKVPSTPADPIDAVIDGVRTAAEVDLRDVTRLLARLDGRHERPDHPHLPARRDGHDHRLPRRDRDPQGHQGRPLGRLQGRPAAVHPAARPLRGGRARRLRRRAAAARRRRRRAARRGGPAQARRRGRGRLLHQLVRQPRERAAHAGDPRGGAAGREHLHLERRPAGDLRARALLDDRRERRALAAHQRLRAAAAVAPRGGRLRRRRPAAALRRRRDDAEDGREAGRPARLLGHRRGRDREPPHRDAVRLRELDRPRHGRHEHRHLARLPGPGADHEGVVRRVRLPDLLPVDRGADDRRRRRLAGLDRRSRLAAQRPAVGRRQPRARLLPARQRRGHEHRCQRRARPPRLGADRRRDDARRRRRRARARGPRRARSASSRWTPRRPSSRSRTRTWPTPSA